MSWLASGLGEKVQLRFARLGRHFEPEGAGTECGLRHGWMNGMRCETVFAQSSLKEAIVMLIVHGQPFFC